MNPQPCSLVLGLSIYEYKALAASLDNELIAKTPSPLTRSALGKLSKAVQAAITSLQISGLDFTREELEILFEVSIKLVNYIFKRGLKDADSVTIWSAYLQLCISIMPLAIGWEPTVEEPRRTTHIKYLAAVGVISEELCNALVTTPRHISAMNN